MIPTTLQIQYNPCQTPMTLFSDMEKKAFKTFIQNLKGHHKQNNVDK